MMSSEELDSITPVTPPIVKRQMKPRAQSMGVSNLLMWVPWMVASQLKILMPVGIAMIMVAAVKYARVSTSIPMVNIWWAQTMNPRAPMPSIA